MDSLDAVLTSRTTAGSEAESRAAVDAPPPRPMGGTREERAARELAERDAASSKARLEARRRRETPEGVTDDSWNPLWSPLSQVYNVPTVEPWAAYALALCHVAAFTAEKTFGPGGILSDKGLIPMPDAERKKFQKDGEMMANNISM